MKKHYIITRVEIETGRETIYDGTWDDVKASVITNAKTASTYFS